MAFKNGILIPIIVGASITVATGLGAWNLNKTAAIPEKYATKEELKEQKEDVNKQYDELRTEQRYIRDAVDDIKNILINHR